MLNNFVTAMSYLQIQDNAMLMCVIYWCTWN